MGRPVVSSRDRFTSFFRPLPTLCLLGLLCLGGALFFPNFAAANQQGPVAAYSFDEGLEAGTTVEDVTGDGHDATIEGAKRTEHGRFGGALEFDGKEGCLSVPTSAELQFSEELTLEAWVRPEGSEEEAHPVITQEDPGASEAEEPYAYELLAGEDEVPKAWIRKGGSGYQGIYANQWLPERVWSHLALTDDGAHLRLYVDGRLVDTEVAPPLTLGSGDLEIGCGVVDGTFQGRIDEVTIYERALSGAELDADMSAPLQTPASGPVAEYSFDGLKEGATTVEDLSGDGNNATIHGGATPTAHGRYGGAIELPVGKEGYLSVPDSPELDPTEEFTIEAWVRPDASSGKYAPLVDKTTPGSPEQPYFLYEGSWEPDLPYGGLESETEAESQSHAKEAIPDDVWTHVALTFDGAKTRLYVNGQWVDSAPGTLTRTSEGELLVGADGYGDFFQGRIDELRIYDRSLHGTEIAADMETPLQTPKQAPIAAYSFDEGLEAGPTVEDVTINEHDGTIEAAKRTEHGRFGEALEFDGEEGCVSIPDSEQLELQEEFTLEAWVRTEGTGEEDPIIYKEHLGGEGFGNVGYSLGVGILSDGRPEGFIGEGGGAFTDVATYETVERGVWTHLAFTYDGAHMRLYMDGELVATQAEETGPLAAGGPLDIGCDGTYGDHFDGRIDEVKIYERALSTAEIGGDMVAPLQTPASAPVAEYSFDGGEEAGGTAKDLSGNENEGSIEGAKSVKGEFGDALRFVQNEGRQCVTVADRPELRLEEEFTLSAWVRPEEWLGSSSIISKELEPGSGQSYSLGIGFTKYGRIEGWSENEVAYSPDPVEEDVWTQVTYTYDGQQARIYLDGELVEEKEVGPRELASTGPLDIGCDASDLGAQFFGRIDEVRIYDRAIEPGEVAAAAETPIQTPRSGPIAAWSFDEGLEAGSTVEDVTGDGHDGTIEGPTRTEHGRYGEALEFQGKANECVTVPESAALDLSEELTIEAWVKPSAWPNDDPIVFKESYGYPGYAMGIGISTEGKPEGIIGEGGPAAEVVEGKQTLEPHVWTHLAFTYDGAHMRLYVDGELVATKAEASPPPAAAGLLAIGCNPLYKSEAFDGRIDEVRIYERALSGREIGESMGALPTVQDGEMYEEEESNAFLTGIVNPMGHLTSITFEYGPTDSYGKSWPETPEENEDFVSGREPREVEQIVEELEPGTTYHYRVVATNALGTVVGPDQTVATSAAEPKPLLSGNHFSGLVGVGYKQSFPDEEELTHVVESKAKIYRTVLVPNLSAAVKKKNDELFEFMTRAHIRILPDVVGIPGGPGNLLPPIGTKKSASKRNRERWKEGLGSLMRRYGPGGTFWEEHGGLDESYAPAFWEIWNEENQEGNADAEPNGKIDPARYGELLAVSHEVVEGIDKLNNPKEEASKELKLLFGGVLTTGISKINPPEAEMKVSEFVRDAGHAEDYDALSLHPYAFKGSVSAVTKKVKANIRAARRVLNRHGGAEKKIWITEIGWPLHKGDKFHPVVDEAVQSERLESVFDMMKRNAGDAKGEFKIKNILYYNIEDFEYPKWDGYCGLFNLGGEPRSALSTFQSQVE